MNIIERIFQRKCNVCRRPKSRAIGEQVDKLSSCGVEQCPFHEDIFLAIREEQKAELLEFNFSKSEALEGSFIYITWQTKNCKSVSITNYGEVELSGQKRIQVKKETEEIEIVLEDLFGETFGAKKTLKVLLKPTFEISECTGEILKGESFFISYSATNFSSIQLKDENGNIIADLSKNSIYSSPPLINDSRFFIYVEGKNGGQVQKEIEIKVFELPVISLFKCDNTEKVDTLPIFFDFAFENTSKAELFLNDTLVADVSEMKSYTHVSENKTETVLFPKYELAVTGLTGKILRTELPNRISVYPQPSIFELKVSPDSIILFPREITLSNRANYCEKIIFSDGLNEKVIIPNSTISLEPTENTTYSFKPIGKQNFHGEFKTILVEVFHPIELIAKSNKKITLPNVPVTISWESKNHTQILIEPGNIDVTNKTSYEIKLENKTTVKVIATNKRDKKEFPLFIDVLQYQRVNKESLRSLPKLDLYVPKLESIIPDIRKNVFVENLRSKNILPINLSTNILDPLKKIIPKMDFGFQRMWRNRMFDELKSLNNKENKV